MNSFQALTDLSSALSQWDFSICLVSTPSYPSILSRVELGKVPGPPPTLASCVDSGMSSTVSPCIRYKRQLTVHQTSSYQSASQRGVEGGIDEWLQQPSIIQMILHVLYRPAWPRHSKEPICYWWLQKWFYLSTKPWDRQTVNSSLRPEMGLRDSP